MRRRDREKRDGEIKKPTALLVAFMTSIVACAAFAFWPLKPAPPPTFNLDKPEPPGSAQLVELDAAAFRIPIWVADPAPPQPVVQAAPPAPPPPSKLQLLAIVHDDGTYRAALYDPDTDKLVVVAAGESVGTRTIAKVEKSSVTIRDESGMRTLALRDSKGAS